MLVLFYLLMLLVATSVPMALTGWRAMRVTRRQAFLSMLAEAIERRIPLIPALEAFGREYWNWQGRTRQLAVALAGGMTLPEALRLLPGLVPPESLPLVEAGQRSGRLAEAFRRAAEQNDRTSPVWQSLAGKAFYVATLLVCMAAIWTFIAIWVVPKFLDIFSDFGMQLPLLTRQMVTVSRILYTGSPLIFLGVLCAIGAGIYAAGCYVGLITCDLPGVRWVLRRLDAANVLDTLALATEAAQPLPEALATLATHYPKRSVQRRLRRVWMMVADGRDWCDGLVAMELLRPAEAGVVQSAVRAGNLPWALRELADSNRRRFAYRMHMVLQVVFPLVMLAVGAMVCFYVTACFLPLVELIEVLA